MAVIVWLILITALILILQIGLVSDGDTAARAQNYSLLACSFTGACSDAHTFQSHVASAGLAASMCSAVHAYAAVKALTARRSGEDSEQVSAYVCALLVVTE